MSTRPFIAGSISAAFYLTHYGPDSFWVGSCEMIDGLLDRTGRRKFALKHLTEAKRILSQFGQTPLLLRGLKPHLRGWDNSADRQSLPSMIAVGLSITP